MCLGSNGRVEDSVDEDPAMLALDVRGGDIVIVVAFESGNSGDSFTAGRWKLPDREVKTCVRDHLAHGNIDCENTVPWMKQG